MPAVETRHEGEIAILEIANPPVNALGHDVRTGLMTALEAAVADPAVKAIVVTGRGRAFSAGADIKEFAAGMREPGLGQVIDAIEASPKPVVAAINGLALGGGLEVALGCHWRVARRDVGQLGLPEVTIGILPGAGGTQRLPRLIGVEPALDMIVSGRPINAAKAQSIGLVDRVADGDVVAAAIAYARELIATKAAPRPTSAKAVADTPGARAAVERVRGETARHPSGPLAARNCIAAVEASIGSDLRAGLVREGALFRELAQSPYARALQYKFFAEREAASLPDLGPADKARAVERVGIVGGGTMGRGIAIAFLNAGLPVDLYEKDPAASERAVAQIGDTIRRDATRGRITAAVAEQRIALLSPHASHTGLVGADLIIEAVFESMAVKKEVFAALDSIAKPGAVLATNTSTLDVDEIARATGRPADVLGLHFFSPANIMRLLEIVRGKATAKDVLATGLAVARRIGKVGVVSGVCFGFIGNRMLEAYLEEVQAMMLEGASPQDIDGALEAWGLAMGPNAMMDLAGLDVGYLIRKEHQLSNERRMLYAVTDRIVESGRHGQKTGKGMYLYAPGERKPRPDPEIESLFRAEAERRGIKQRKPAPEEIVERCLLRLANEGARILEEKIALRASDIDTIYLTGYGMAGWRGGPMWQVKEQGLARVADRIRAYERAHGPRWSLAPLIAERAASGKGLD